MSKKLVSAVLLSALYWSSPVLATEADDAAEIAGALIEFGGILGDLDDYEQLGLPLPLLNIAPGGPAIFDIGTVFADSLGSLPASPPTFSDLENALNGTWTTATGASITISGAAVSGSTVIDVGFDLSVTHPGLKLPVDVLIQDGPVNGRIIGGATDLAVDFTVHFDFQLDTDETNPDVRFAMVYNPAPPVIQIPIQSSASVSNFPDVLGLTEITVNSSVTIDITFELALNDPDSDGEITLDELRTTAIDDLFTAGEKCATTPDDISATFTLISPLLPGADSTISFADACVDDGLDLPTITWNELREFSNVSPAQVLQALSALAATVQGSHAIADVPLPFVDRRLSRMFSFAEPIVGFLDKMSAALIVCGPVNDDPPRGNILELPGGSTIYCQAVTLEVPTADPTWSIRPGGVGQLVTDCVDVPFGAPCPAGPKNTVSNNATQNAVFTTPPGGGLPDVQVEFNDSFGDHTINRRFISIQEAVDQLVELAGFGATSPVYDSATKTLTIRLTRSFDPTPPDPAKLKVGFDFNDQLYTKTNLGGLVDTSSASLEIDPGLATIDVKLGLILADDPDPSIPEPPPPGDDPIYKDRFFIQKVTGSSKELALDDVAVTANLELAGAIGFVGVSAVGDTTPATPAIDGPGFTLEKLNGGSPLFAVDLELPGITDLGTTIPDAIRFRKILRNLSTYAKSDINLKMRGGLRVEAAIGATTAGGGVELAWDITDASNIGEPTINTVGGFDSALKVFDFEPALTGRHDGADDVSKLVDGAQTMFGTAELVNTTLRNLTDGSQCIVQPGEASASGIDCVLTGGDENDWDTGDRYSVGGNRLALMSIILDNLDLLVSTLESTGALDQEIPMIGKSARQLVTELEELKQKLVEFRSQQAIATIACRPLDGSNNPIPGGKMIGIAPGGQFECQGLSLTDDPQSLQWSITGAGGSPVANDDNVATVVLIGENQNAHAWARFQVTNGGDLGDFEITLDLVDAQAQSHPVTLPVQPLTLQTLGDRLACELGIPAASIALAIEDLPLPGTASPDGVPDLVFGLSYGFCTVDPGPDTLFGTADDVANINVDLACMPGDQLVAKGAATLHLELPPAFNGSELVGLDVNDPQLRMEFRAAGRFDIGIPITTGLTPEQVVVKDTSQFLVGTAANATGLTVGANIGPLRLLLDGEARVGAKIVAATADPPAGKTWYLLGPVDNFTDELSGTFDSLSVKPDCGNVSVVDREGNHDGADDDASLTDTTASFDSSLVGRELRNFDDNSTCTVTGFTATTLDCTLTGGTDNDWDIGDAYKVGEFSILLEGDVCSKMDLAIDVAPEGSGPEDVDLGEFAFRIEQLKGNVPKQASDELHDSADWFLTYPTDLLAQITSAKLDLAMLFRMLPTILENVGGALESAEDVPLVGGGLEEIGGGIDAVNNEVVTPLVDAVLAVTAVTVGAAETEIFDFIVAEICLGGPPLPCSTGLVDVLDVEVVGRCGSPLAVCPGDPIGNLDDLKIKIVLGDGGEPDPDSPGDPTSGNFKSTALKASFGIPGLPLKMKGDLEAVYGWRMPIEFGLNRSLGPYLVAAMDFPPTATTAGTSLRLGARIQVVNGNCNLADPPTTKLGDPIDSYTSRCIAGRIGFLDVNFRDGKESEPGGRTLTSLFAFTALTSGANPVVPFSQIIGGTSLAAGLRADTNVNLRFRTGVAGAGEEFPSILGTAHVAATWRIPEDVNDPGGACPNSPNGLCRIGFENLYLDAGTFLSQIVSGPVSEVKNVTKPLQPVIDVARAPLPVVSDLAQAVGQPPITLLTLIELQNGPDSTRLINRLMEVIAFINAMPSDPGGNFFIALGNPNAKSPLAGSFDIDMAQLGGAPKTPDNAGKLIDFSKTTSSSITSAVMSTSPGAGKAFGVQGLSFPFLDNSSQIFALLMGQDVVLIRYDAGTMGVTAGFLYNFGPFFVGPVPVTVGIGGDATLQARFAMGYDTSGIRKALEDGGSGEFVIDGIFLDDLDVNGVDVAEISLIGRVYAQAGVDLGIVAAGIRGGIEFTTDLNLDDRPDPDGRLHIEEISQKLHNPLCLFVISGKLDAFLAGWVRVGFEWFSKEWEIEFVRITLLEFEVKCEPPPPKLAAPGIDLLVLNVGSKARRDARNLQSDREKEKVVVRQIGDRLYAVIGFGLTQTFGSDYGLDGIPGNSDDIHGDFAIPGTGTVTIQADLDTEDDTLAFEDGVKRLPGPDMQVGTDDDIDQIVQFIGKGLVTGGVGNDLIRTGWGVDKIWGNDGNDRIESGAGADEIRAGSGNDNVSAEGGNDNVWGGAGNDTITGGPGTDTLYGGKDDDNLNGGWAATQDLGGPGDEEDPRLDMADIIVGGEGNDVIDGSFGNDWLYGDFLGDGEPPTPLQAKNHRRTLVAVMACEPGAATGGFDHISGGAGDDRIWGGFNPPGSRDGLSGDSGDDFICGNGGDDLIDGDDLIASTPDGDDYLMGGAGHDGIWGRGGNDWLEGGAHNDELFGGVGHDDLIGGTGRDRLAGDEGNDVLVGDDGWISTKSPMNRGSDVTPPIDAGFVLSSVTRAPESGSAQVVGDCFLPGGEADVPRMGTGLGSADCMFGGDGHDLLFGDNAGDGIYGDKGDDFVEGGAGDDTVRGGKGADVLYGHRREGDTDWRLPAPTVSTTGLSDADEVFGDSGDDDLYGGPDDDLCRGGIGEDYVEGNQDGPDGDTLFGDAGDDDIIGGSSVSGTDDGSGDELFGNGGHDVLLGDNAQVTRTGGSNSWDGSAERIVQILDLVTQGAGDALHGNQGNDWMWGELGDDEMWGDQGDDHMEGNGDNDHMWGGLGQDDLIGGTGRTKSDDPASAVDGRDDGADWIWGGDDADDLADDLDAIAGDNATIDRPLDGAGQWIVNTFNAGVSRDVWLYDISSVDTPAAASSFGHDKLYGEGSDDIMWGQGGDDEMYGGTGFDTMMGNDDADVMFGDDDNDDMMGGTGRINDDPIAGIDGRHDVGDVMHGGEGFDVMAGDNGVLARSLDGAGAWIANTFDGGTQHEWRILRDIDSLDSGDVSGPDVMNGNQDNDLMYGQGDDDLMHGNEGDDVMEGNAADDQMFGDDDEDDMYGGTVERDVTDGDDVMHGDAAGDIMLGDNGSVTRPVDGGGQWLHDPNTGDVIRNVVLYDVLTTTASFDPSRSGGDTMFGDDARDYMYGQGGSDTMRGGFGPDSMEGNHGVDLMHGDGGEDEMIGGGSANDGVISDASIGDTLLDEGDVMYGDEGGNGGEDDGDVMTGDNGRLVRSVDSSDIWLIDPNVDDVIRAIALFDVEVVGGLVIDENTSGSDRMFGEAGRDLMFGQGNDPSDDDGDGHVSEDPPDGVDNDHDGRESAGSTGYDCADRRDNDGDGNVDGNDPDCQLGVDEDFAGDEMSGGPGVDYMEGNHGADWMFGDGDEDDMIGGSSAGDGVIGGGVPPTGLLDGDDTMEGGAEDDVMLGDNVVVVRPVDGGGLWLRLTGGLGYDLADRDTTMDPAPEPDGAFGDDFMLGQGGDDEMYGQMGSDYMEGNHGDDAMVGDLGKVTTNIEDGSRQRTISSPSPFLEDVIYVTGTLHRETILYSFLDGDGAEGHDTMLGGDGDDSEHGGPGDDIMNGDGDGIWTGVCEEPFQDPDLNTVDEDHLFGGDGNDVVWGGRGHDHLWGGHHDDNLDVRAREERIATKPNEPSYPADPPEWFTWGEPDSYQGYDLVHGAWGQDAMQVDVGGPGPQDGDRLIDWAGAYNVFYVCPPAYGEGYIIRNHAPWVQAYLQDLAESDGAVLTRIKGNSGFRELGYVFPPDIRFNTHPPHPDHPGHFTCDCGTEEKNLEAGSDQVEGVPDRARIEPETGAALRRDTND